MLTLYVMGNLSRILGILQTISKNLNFELSSKKGGFYSRHNNNHNHLLKWKFMHVLLAALRIHCRGSCVAFCIPFFKKMPSLGNK